ncbi:SAM-dependent methyltransferase [Catenulispora sp. MAP12-49]|uniref:class I SAM-dependent methyltransferase n=1 Tax=Catenulispora sp. MAP12-49 TaxID=3156302 RepID=UPI0035196642
MNPTIETVDRAPAAGPAPKPAAVWDPLGGRTLAPAPDGARLRAGWAARDALSAARLALVLQQMGAFAAPGERRDRSALDADLGVAAEHRPLFGVLIDVLLAAGLLRAEGEAVVAAEPVAALAGRDLAAESAALVAAHPEVTAQTALLDACLAEYPRLLRGEVKPINVLFPGWNMDLVEGVYRGDPVSDRLNELAAESVAEPVFAARRAGPLRILEVGAGTGGTTTQILETVATAAGRFTFTYTDISASFLRHGRRRFAADHPTMRFDRLDIEADPAEQGFEPGAFDLVVAANVLHATADLPRTLANVAQLLSPGGRLVLREITTPMMFVTMSFGLLDGWWSAQDGLRIPGSPLAGVPTWTRLLHDAGFARVAALAPVAGEGAADVFGQHVIVAER